MSTTEADQEYQRAEAYYRELSEEEDKKFEQLTKEFLDQANTRKELAEFMQAHKLYFRQSADALEIVMVAADGLERIIYMSSAKKIFPLNMVNISLTGY